MQWLIAALKASSDRPELTAGQLSLVTLMSVPPHDPEERLCARVQGLRREQIDDRQQHDAG